MRWVKTRSPICDLGLFCAIILISLLDSVWPVFSGWRAGEQLQDALRLEETPPTGRKRSAVSRVRGDPVWERRNETWSGTV